MLKLYEILIFFYFLKLFLNYLKNKKYKNLKKQNKILKFFIYFYSKLKNFSQLLIIRRLDQLHGALADWNAVLAVNSNEAFLAEAIVAVSTGKTIEKAQLVLVDVAKWLAVTLSTHQLFVFLAFL
jgi:hypothetical protein